MFVENKIRLVIAEDHPAVRQGIRRLLNRRGDIEIVGESDNGYDALHQVQDTKPDVLLLDLDMPGIDGVEVIRRVKQLKLPVRILVLSGYGDEDLIHLVLEQGVSGYLVKDDAPQKVGDSIRQIANRRRKKISSHLYAPGLSGLGGNSG